MLEPLPAVEPLQHRASPYARQLPTGAAFSWLAAGWRDLRRAPWPSLGYGLVIFLASVLVIWAMVAVGLPWLIFPALSGFLVVGPILAIGLYEKSRRHAAGKAVRLSDMVLVRPASGGQVLFAGLLLCLLVVLWLRAADLLYALFFGLLPFPGFDQILAQLLTTPRGWALVATGSAIGGLFAAFAMAISLFSIPMLLSVRTDALTALGTSFALTTQNLRAVLPWGGIVVAGFAFSVATGLLGLIVVFPLLGHGTWHAWQALRPDADPARQDSATP
ncbi:DUF2189 domain-containing protein [Maliponia aquimaris]|uniref:DUF2189 domain-containing protein n=1 Tax=Maliponia aquimaris TaxID=1673631 RepID=A0A238L1U9_9RHOB|nr:DUF2189 domain-containing protein [Maliponia aquimaris]SMX48791.1 hypothetical protein MAA8898_04100 [Maliponia aquimaris]